MALQRHSEYQDTMAPLTQWPGVCQCSNGPLEATHASLSLPKPLTHDRLKCCCLLYKRAGNWLCVPDQDFICLFLLPGWLSCVSYCYWRTDWLKWLKTLEILEKKRFLKYLGCLSHCYGKIDGLKWLKNDECISKGNVFDIWKDNWLGNHA